MDEEKVWSYRYIHMSQTYSVDCGYEPGRTRQHSWSRLMIQWTSPLCLSHGRSLLLSARLIRLSSSRVPAHVHS